MVNQFALIDRLPNTEEVAEDQTTSHGDVTSELQFGNTIKYRRAGVGLSADASRSFLDGVAISFHLWHWPIKWMLVRIK